MQCGVVILISFNDAPIAGLIILYRVFRFSKVHIPSADCAVASLILFSFIACSQT